MNLKEIEKVVATIRTHLFRNSNSFSVGMLKSHFKGAGLQFKEHQVYAPGDDVRFIDWKLSAKSDNTFVKTFEEERNVEIIVAIDIASNMLTGYKGISKLQSAIEITCLLYLLAEQSKDKVKVVIMLEKAVILPSQSGHKGIALFVSLLEKNNILMSNGKVNFRYSFDKMMSETKKLGLLKSFVAKGKEVVFLSDFSEIEQMDVLNKLIYRKNMHCFKVVSPLDEVKKQPFSIFTTFKGKKRLISPDMRHNEELHGRWKKINVAERYLEDFVKEML
jgi:hypothetical protein